MHKWLRPIIALAFLTLMLMLGYHQTQAPNIRTDSDLDYEALNGHIERIASKPHPMGGQANREVRDYIVAYFESLGLSTEIQKTTVVYRHPTRSNQNTTVASVENIIARLPGSSAKKEGVANTLALLTHYDSRPLTPGAADDASGTATVMEVARLMVSDPAPAHDVLFVVTDGEEMGLLGAQGFFRQHPAAEEIGLVLNLEARGSSGVSSMFETSENNDWLIESLVNSAPDLVADSLSYEIYSRMPNDTDMSISKGEGIPGLNFGFVGGFFDYHSMTDTPENINQESVAQQANYLLFAARHFANTDSWQSGTANVTYFSLWAGQMVTYSQAVATGTGVVVLVFGLWVFIVRARKGALRLSTIGTGLLAIFALLSIVSSIFESMIDQQYARADGIARIISLGEWALAAYFVVVLGISAWFASALKRGFSPKVAFIIPLGLAVLSLLAGRPWQAAVIMMAVLLPLLLILSKRKNPPDIWGAGLMLWWVLTAVVVVVAPNASYILVLPLAGVLLTIGPGQSKDGVNADLTVSRAIVASFVPLVFLPTLLVMAYLALGSTLPQFIMMISVVCLLLIWPLVQQVGQAANGKLGSAMFVLGAALTVWVMLGDGFDARTPRQQGLFLATDANQSQSFWVSPDARPGTWAGDFLGEDASDYNMNEILPGYLEKTRRGELFGESVEAAVLSVTDKRTDGEQTELTLHLMSPSGAEYVNLLFPRDMSIIEASANGFPVPVPGSSNTPGVNSPPDADKNRDSSGGRDWWRWRWYGLPVSGAEIVLRLGDKKPIEIRVVEVDYGMPEGPPQRPANVMARKYSWSDSRVIFQTVLIEP
jgi:hypothetical protein